MPKRNPFIVSADWLENHLNEQGLVILDASWYLPGAGRDPKKEYEQAHIPGAIFFDQDAISDQSSSLPHTLPTVAEFEHHAGAMGIRRDDTIVVYDGDGFFSAPRAWWVFHIMGAGKVYVLNGGFRGWKKEGRPVTAEKTLSVPAVFHADFDKNAVVMLDEMRTVVNEGNGQIADARGKGRFTGEEPEPRSGIRSGHMPGARNMPWGMLSKDGYLKTADEIRSAFVSAGIDPDKPVITSCGSGITAAVLTLALQSLGNRDVRLYDGSWSEWGSLPDTPVEKGEAK